MDDVDLRLVELMAEDGRASNSQLARQLGVSEGTVRHRLKRLQESGTVRVQTQVKGDELLGSYLVVVGLNVDGRDLEGCAERIDCLPEVQRTLIVTGRYDLLVILAMGSHSGLVDFITQRLSRVPGVRYSETFVCLKDYDSWYPAASLAAFDPNNRRQGDMQP